LARKLSPSRSADGDDLNIDKRKPFSRPFSKSRLDTGKSGPSRMSSSSPPRGDTGVLLKQNNDLRQRLQDESSNYRRRLDTYKQAQHNQAALISRLQSKVLQYKQRCSELEGQINETISTEPSCLDSTLKYDHLRSLTPTTSVPPCGSYGSVAPQSLPCAGLLDYPTPPAIGAREVDDLAKRFEEERRRCANFKDTSHRSV
jgi:Ciliary rootlet component, centrosome cohesion